MSQPSTTHEPLESRIARILGDTVVRSRTLTGGMMGDVIRVELAGHDAVVAKHAAPASRLTLEARMLRHLRASETAPVPDVLFAEDDLLILEELPGNHIQPDAEPHLGALLATLHGVTSDAFGFGGNTLNGRIVLQSPWSSSWVEFYRDLRLRFSLDLAMQYQQLPWNLIDDLHRIIEHTDTLLREPEQPSLLHGDLWAANVLSVDDRVTGIIDPSACYGDPEIELAYVDAWQSFGAGFWDAYASVRPIDPDFYLVRRHVYALYPLLMHIYYFGERFLPRLGQAIAAITPHL